MSYSLLQVNQMSQSEFVEAFGTIFEHTPEIADRAWNQRPFQDASDLHQKLVAEVQRLSNAEQLALIRAHPDLGSRAKMAAASVKEQAGAGLDRLSPEEYELFLKLNQQYQEKFNFPFIIAVKNHHKASILESFQQRLQNDREIEQIKALQEICEIARFRLQALL